MAVRHHDLLPLDPVTFRFHGTCTLPLAHDPLSPPILLQAIAPIEVALAAATLEATTPFDLDPSLLAPTSSGPLPAYGLASRRPLPLPIALSVSPSEVAAPLPASVPPVAFSEGDLFVNEGSPIPQPTFTYLKGPFQASLPSKVRVTLDQPFGKDNINQSFTADCRLRHVLLPLFKSNFLGAVDHSCLERAYRPALVLRRLLHDHANVDFSPLRGFQANWEEETDINEHRTRMITAAFLHFDCCAATVVRYIGGPHTAAHRDPDKILATLRPSVDPAILSDVERLLKSGVPNYINAHSSEANFQAFRTYGNHGSITNIPESDVRKTLVKSFKRGYVLVMNHDLVDFVPNMHLTPQGIVDLDNPHKNPRPIFDSTCRPQPWCDAINDWTNKCNEPELIFATGFLVHLVWLWNMRISYPNEEIYLGDNDVSGAFNHNKYNPMLVALHAFVLLGFLCMNSANTFGDNSSPSNFEPWARARQQHAQYLWLTRTTASLLAAAAHYNINIQLAPPPTPSEIQQFSPAYADSINKGVFDDRGQRLPPPYPHHVDDNFYSDVARYLGHTIAASVIALYTIFGDPDPLRPDPLSRDKFLAFHNHLRKTVGYMLNSRSMRVSILEYKRDQMLELLLQWLSMVSFTLQQAATFHGKLESLSKYCPWARVWFFALQNAIRRILSARFHYIKRTYNRKRRRQQLEGTMPAGSEPRITQLLVKEKAQLLWSHHPFEQYTVTSEIQFCTQSIFDHLSNRNNDWGQQIAHIVPRDPTFTSLGDASNVAGGGYSDDLRWWFQVNWSPAVLKLINLGLKHPNRIHINSLEFVVVILQYAAVLTRMRELDTPAAREAFRSGGFPWLPILLLLCDNIVSVSWAHRVTSSSLRGQALIPIFAALLEDSPVGIAPKHIAGVDNVDADFISRPPTNHLLLSPSERREQIFHSAPRMRLWDIFVPSPDLCSLLTSSLCTGQCPARPVLPSQLGHFIPGDSTSYILPAI